MGLSEAFGVARVLGWARGLFGPLIEFGSPRQDASEPHLSWWHVPVSLGHRRFWRKDALEDCEVFLIGHNDPAPRRPISLRWRSRDHAEGESKITLRHGKTHLVPLFQRNEKSLDSAVITGEAFLLSHDERKFPLSPGIHLKRLRLRSGGKNFDSPHLYKLKVPEDGESNGQFILEVYRPDPD